MYITVPILTIPKSIVYWKMIQCSRHCQYIHYVEHSHVSSQRSKGIPYISFGFTSFLYVDFFHPVNPHLKEGLRSTGIRTSRYLECVPYLTLCLLCWDILGKERRSVDTLLFLFLLCSWVRASWINVNNCPERRNYIQFIILP